MVADFRWRLFALLAATLNLHANTLEEVCNSKEGKCSQDGLNLGCDFSILDLAQMGIQSGSFDELHYIWENYIIDKGPVLIRNALNHPKSWAKKDKLLDMLGSRTFRIPNETKRRWLGPTMAGLDTNLTDWHRLVQENDTRVPAALFTSQPQLMDPLIRTSKAFEVPMLLRGVLFGTFLIATGKRGANLPPHQHAGSWSALAQGKKFWWVAPPEVDVDSIPPDWMEDVSIERGAEIHSQIPGAKGCLQKAGEIVLLPDGWFHGTWAETPWTFGYGGQGSAIFSHAAFNTRLGRTSELQKEAPTPQEIREDELLSAALRSSNAKMIQFILSRGGDALLHEFEPDGLLPIHMACFSMAGGPVKVLLEHGADANARTAIVEEANKYFGPHVTPLHVCSAWGHVEGATFLLAAKADINTAGAYAPAMHTDPSVQLEVEGGSTPLHFAAYAGHTNAVEQLLDHRAKINVKDIYGDTPLDLAITNEWPAVVEVLQAAKSKKKPSNKKKTP
mmetsp:Transcript_25394/g.46059  ORF Transcript_25394/g.46059 Transcript_25394/m.46059 type:complete len:504 (+) Transcript_25394:61-1572(+)